MYGSVQSNLRIKNKSQHKLCPTVVKERLQTQSKSLKKMTPTEKARLKAAYIHIPQSQWPSHVKKLFAA